MGLFDNQSSAPRTKANKLSEALMGNGSGYLPSAAAGMSPEQLKAMSWDQLYDARLANRDNPQAQADLAPYEHMAWARQQGETSPLHALTTGLIMNPLYQAAKFSNADKLFQDRDEMSTPASFEELAGGVKGGLLGAGDWFRNELK